MMASRESSLSEGEISDNMHKANTESSHPAERGVDHSSSAFGLDGTSDDPRHKSRYPRSPASRSPSPYHERKRFPRSPSPYHKGKQSSRSPSPYYKGKQSSRSSSPYHATTRRVGDRSGIGYSRHDPRNTRGGASHHRFNEDNRRYDSDTRGHEKHDRRQDIRRAGPPKRKASPNRNSRPDKRHQPEQDEVNAQRRSNRYGLVQGDSYHSKDSVDQARNSDAAQDRISYADKEHTNIVPSFGQEVTQGKQLERSVANGQRKETPQSVVPVVGLDARPSKEKTSATIKGEDELDLTTLVVVEDKIPTTEFREAKKRRWAAMRKDLAGENTNLLHQAVLTNASEATTPNIGSPVERSFGSVSPSGSPRLPNLNSAPASPGIMVIDKEENTSHAASPTEGGSPSAAYYDPTEDMLKDRVRAENRAQHPEMSATSYDETNPKMLSTLPSEKARPAKKQKKEIDMFADSDDDDSDEEGENGEEDDQIVGTKGTVLDEKLLDNWDDPDGYYKIIPNELVNAGRYRMMKSLGRGVFANVAQAEDVTVKLTSELTVSDQNSKDKDAKDDGSEFVAIKIIRRNDAMKKASQKEMDFLRRLNDEDPHDRRHIIRFLGTFDHKGHLCIVFEHMHKNLRDLLKDATSGQGVKMKAVKQYAQQMFSGLKHLQACQVIHADLKPDNILVSHDLRTVKLCDFGTAVDKRDNSESTSYLVSRFYRAPEIILGMEIGYAIDMWAIGCTIYELWSGKILFPGRSNNQMIKVMIEGLGWPTERVLKKGQFSGVHFEQGPPLKFISREFDRNDKPITRLIEQSRLVARPLKARVLDAGEDIPDKSTTELNDLVDLLGACLNWNLAKRIQPNDALSHKFFASNKPGMAARPAEPRPTAPTVIKVPSSMKPRFTGRR